MAFALWDNTGFAAKLNGRGGGARAVARRVDPGAWVERQRPLPHIRSDPKRLRLDFVKNDRAQAIEVHFNTVMDWLYREALELLLRGTGGSGQWASNGGGKPAVVVEVLTIKFRNGMYRYLPAGYQS
jgi:hypothetical protein